MNAHECPHAVIDKFVTRAGLVCFACVPPAEFARYPGWRAREDLKHDRAALARRNFGKSSQQSAISFQLQP